MVLELGPDDRVHGNEAEDAGLADGALLMSISSYQPRNEVWEFGTEVVHGRECGHLQGVEREEGERERGRERGREGGRKEGERERGLLLTYHSSKESIAEATYIFHKSHENLIIIRYNYIYIPW